MESVEDTPFLASIGTTHPWNIAGVGLDARVAAEYNVPHASVIVSVSAQDAGGVHALQAISADVVRMQLQSLPAPIGAYRIGALVSSENAMVVAEFLRERAGRVPIVLDPVLSASLGGRLQTDTDLARTIRDELLPLGVIVTPNLPEAGQLIGTTVRSEPAMLAAAYRLVELGAGAALVTGGHLDGDPVDVLVGRGIQERLDGPRLAGSMRGSGCTLAASLACELAHGVSIPLAAAKAHAYVREKIAAHTMRAGLQVAF